MEPTNTEIQLAMSEFPMGDLMYHLFTTYKKGMNSSLWMADALEQLAWDIRDWAEIEEGIDA